jgi:hypothetical protein
MMSAAILITGSEQAKVGTVSAARNETGRISFAESLDVSVGDSSSLQEKNGVSDSTTELRSTHGAVVAKQPDGVVEALEGLKSRTFAVQKASKHEDLTSMVSAKVAQTPRMDVAASQQKTLEGGAAANQIGLPVEVEEPAKSDAPEVASGTLTGPADSAMNENDVSPVNTAGAHPLRVTVGVSAAVQGSAETAGNASGVSSAKQTLKLQESTTAPKIVKKSVGPAGDAVVVGAMLPVASPAPGITSAVEQAVATSILPQSAVGSAKAEVDAAVTGGSSVGTAVHAVVTGLARQELMRGEKPKAPEGETTVPSAIDSGIALKSGVGQERASAISPLIGGEGDARPQSITASFAAVVHAVSGGVGVSSDVAPSIVMVSNTPANLNLAHVPAGNAIAHAAGLPVGPREQDGTGFAAAPLDGMPRMLASTPTSLEVGIHDGTNGWLKVRAEMADGGVVNASVSSPSPTAIEMLHRELPALTAYLQEEKVAVNAVVVHAASSAGGEGRSFLGADGGGQTPQRGNEEDRRSQNPGYAKGSDANDAAAYRSLNGVDGEGSLPLNAFESGRGWLSVRA